MPVYARLSSIMEGQRGFLLPWAPVLTGVGVGVYFTLRAEPGQGVWTAVGMALAVLGGLLPLVPILLRPWLLIPTLILAGFATAGLRAHMVAAPVLDFRYYGPIQGRVVGIDRSASDRLRLTLDRVVLRRVDPDETPRRVRVSLHAGKHYVEPRPGTVVMLTGHLAATEGPVEPGGYDFRRQAWFDGLGAVGYMRTPLLMVEPPPGGMTLLFDRMRIEASAWVRRTIDGQPGALAAALMTGDRSGLSKESQDDMRAANLSHMISISGLHMVLVCGAVFAALRLALALIPPLALRWPIRKIAAVAALAAGLAYLLLSGVEVPAERAYIMVAVMFCAVLVDRRAISLRSVALAAIIVLCTRPETMMEPGFQMSFAATVALVTAFGAFRGRAPLPRWTAPAVAVVLSSVVAGTATAPFAAAHFNRVSAYGLLANLLVVPLTGVAAAWAALLAVVLAPLGLGWIGLRLFELPMIWTLSVAHEVAVLPGAVGRLVAPPAAALPLLALGGLFAALWHAPLRVRALGLAPVALAFLLWSQADRPALLISGEGGLMGLMTPEGRALSKPKGQGFAALSWLEDDGDGADQETAAARPGFSGGKGEVRAEVAGLTVVQIAGRGAAERAVKACGAGVLVILAADKGVDPPPGCTLLDRRALAVTGPISISPGPRGPVIETVRGQSGTRLWMRPGQVPEIRVTPARPPEVAEAQ